MPKHPVPLNLPGKTPQEKLRLAQERGRKLNEEIRRKHG